MMYILVLQRNAICAAKITGNMNHKTVKITLPKSF